MSYVLERIKNDTRLAGTDLVQKIGRYPFFSRIDSASAPITTIEGIDKINFGSNNYLGLSTHPEVKLAVKQAVDNWGAGVTGSRILNGTLKIHKELESMLASFYQKEAALIFSTGYQANLSLLSAIFQPNDYILVDEDIHASVIDGLIFSRVKFKRFNHNDMEHLASLIKKSDKPIAACIVEGIYSMKGDSAPLKEIVDICKKNNILIIDDEAHGLGTQGKSGAGVAEKANVLSNIDITVITFSKSLGSCGGAIISDKLIIDMLKANARPFIFTASNTPASIIAAKTALQLLIDHPEMVEELNNKIQIFKEKLQKNNIGFIKNCSPIIPIPIGEDMKVLQAWKILWNRGLFCNPVLTPAVEKGMGLLRLSLMRTHDNAHLDNAIEALTSIKSLILKN